MAALVHKQRQPPPAATSSAASPAAPPTTTKEFAIAAESDDQKDTNVRASINALVRKINPKEATSVAKLAAILNNVAAPELADTLTQAREMPIRVLVHKPTDLHSFLAQSGFRNQVVARGGTIDELTQQWAKIQGPPPCIIDVLGLAAINSGQLQGMTFTIMPSAEAVAHMSISDLTLRYGKEFTLTFFVPGAVKQGTARTILLPMIAKFMRPYGFRATSLKIDQARVEHGLQGLGGPRLDRG